MIKTLIALNSIFIRRNNPSVVSCIVMFELIVVCRCIDDEEDDNPVPALIVIIYLSNHSHANSSDEMTEGCIRLPRLQHA